MLKQGGYDLMGVTFEVVAANKKLLVGLVSISEN